ncbi:MAG TPA: arylesterase [Longimicrobiaceae bacterium]|nr:arylesterase [Longimicrobiaceae bacterium]
MRASVLLLGVCFIVGCREGESNRPPGQVAAGEERAAPAGERKVVMVVGTSLTAALGLDPEQGYPARLQEKVDSAGLPFDVVNAGHSGETSAGALSRMRRWLVRQPFDVLVLETGANDMLRGASVDSLRANLQAIIDTVRGARPDARIVLAGMVAAPNLGRRYAEAFGAVYPELARENGVVLIPFLLEGVAGDTAFNLGDGIHPNERGHGVIAATVWRTLEPVLRAEAAE